MIKRRFYKLEHGDRDAPSESSSSSDDSELEAAATEDEEEYEYEEEDDNDTKEEEDDVARLTGGNESSSGMFILMICSCFLSLLFADIIMLRGISRSGMSRPKSH